MLLMIWKYSTADSWPLWSTRWYRICS